MIVRDLDVGGVAATPPETDSVLVIDANAILSLSLAMQLLKPIPRGNAQISYGH